MSPTSARSRSQHSGSEIRSPQKSISSRPTHPPAHRARLHCKYSCQFADLGTDCNTSRKLSPSLRVCPRPLQYQLSPHCVVARSKEPRPSDRTLVWISLLFLLLLVTQEQHALAGRTASLIRYGGLVRICTDTTRFGRLLKSTELYDRLVCCSLGHRPCFPTFSHSRSRNMSGGRPSEQGHGVMCDASPRASVADPGQTTTVSGCLNILCSVPEIVSRMSYVGSIARSL